MNLLIVEAEAKEGHSAHKIASKAYKKSSNIFIAHSAEEVHSYIQNYSIDIILIDLDFPNLGLSIFYYLIQQKIRIPIVVLVGAEKEVLGQQCVEEGAKDYLIKGKYDAFLLTKIIKQVFERKKYQLHEKQLSLQLRIATILAELSSIHLAGSSILKTICEIFSFSIGEIWAVNLEDQVLCHVLNWYEHSVLNQVSLTKKHEVLRKGEDLPGFIWGQQQIYYTHDLDKSPFAEDYKKYISRGFNICFGFPIVFKEEILGVAIFYGSQLEEFDSDMMAVFKLIGKQIGSFFKSRRLEKDLLFLIQHDLLTGLPNKEFLNNFLEHALIQAKKEDAIIALLYLNLDRLHNINYSLGHSVGDLVLRKIAHRLQSITRKTDLVARLGGDEFALVLTGIRLKEHIELIARKILNEIERPFILEGTTCYITASLGISLYPEDAASPKELFISAGLAMYQSKFSGRNKHQYVSSDWQKQRQKNIIMETHLHDALKKKEFYLCYQPILQLKTNRIIGVEALCRWKNERGELILPMDFIPILEQSDLIQSIGEWVLEQACTDLITFQKFHLSTISVNVSAYQLTTRFVKFVQYLLSRFAIDTSSIILEITESALIDRSKDIMDIITTFNDIGVQLSIDDFGTGYSTFSHLKNFKIDFLKIDKSFISEINKSQNVNNILKAMIVMAHELGMHVIAEGVERSEELDFLSYIGCESYQGYYYSKPLCLEEVIELLKKEKKETTVSLMNGRKNRFIINR